MCSEKKPKMDHMLAGDIFNVLIGIVMNDFSSGLIKVPEDIQPGNVFIYVNPFIRDQFGVKSMLVTRPFRDTVGDRILITKTFICD